MAIGKPISLTDNVASKVISSIATAGQTLFTVNGGYRINAIVVYRNGVCLVEGNDYTATDGATVSLVVGANLDDSVEFHIFDDFRVADAVGTSGDSTIEGSLTVTGTISGASVGINSAGTSVGAAKTLNFIGTGNTFHDNGDGIIDVSIAGGGGGGVGTAINYIDESTSPFTYIDTIVDVTENMLFDTTNSGKSDSLVVSVIPEISIASGIAVTVGVGKTMVIDVLQIGDL